MNHRASNIGKIPMIAAALAALAVTAPAITLDRCVEMALEFSPDLQSAAARVQSARAMVQQAESARYPQLSLSAGYSRTDNPPQAFFMSLNQRQASMMGDFNNPEDTDNTRLSAGARWLLYDGGRRENGLRAAHRGREAAQEAWAAARNELVFLVTRSYYGRLQAQAYVAVQRQAVASLEESLRVARERFKAGSAVQTDALNLEVELARAQEDLIRAENGVRLAAVALNTAVGADVVGAEQLPEPDLEPAGPPPAQPAAEAVEQRPELKAARAMTRLREAEYRKARGEYRPAVSAFGSVDWDSEAFSDFEQSYMAGVMASVEVFTGWRRGGTLALARAQREEALANERAARQKLQMDLEQAWLQTTEAWERLNVASKSLASAEEALRITQEQYRQGAADITLLLTAQVGLTAMRTRHVASQYEYRIALSNLARARGVAAAGR